MSLARDRSGTPLAAEVEGAREGAREWVEPSMILRMGLETPTGRTEMR
jgi:hypothetical protein